MLKIDNTENDFRSHSMRSYLSSNKFVVFQRNDDNLIRIMSEN